MTGNGRVKTWSCPPPPLDSTRLLRIHKYTDPSQVRPIILEAAERTIQEAARLSAPTARYVTSRILSLKNGELELENGVAFSCPAFDERLAGCERLIAFVMTLGPDLDAKTISLIEDEFEPLDALFLETAGWLTIEAATRQMAAFLRRETAEEGWRMSLRMGPGYDYPQSNGDGRVRWDLAQQQALFRLFDGNPLPVTLMSSCAMMPKMSRSGVFGLSPAD